MDEALRPSVSELIQLGRLPTDEQADAQPVRADRWADLIGEVHGDRPINDAEAAALVDLLPENDTDCYGVAWTLVHAIESAPGWPLEKELNSVSGPWVELLEQRSSSGSAVQEMGWGGGVAVSTEDEWEPVFAGPSPRYWIVFARTAAGVSQFSNVVLSADDKKWLASWLSEHPREPDEEASYIYLGLNPGWRRGDPDGTVQADAVTGLGSGMYFAEPPGSVPSTIMEIIVLARRLLENHDA